MKMNPKSYQSESGFTVVEMIVVIVIVGLLAGLVALSWNNWRTSAAQKAVKSDLKLASVAMENAKNFGTGYPTSLPATYEQGKDVTVTYMSGSATSYCIRGVSTIVASVSYIINSANGSEPVVGACP